MVKEQSLEWIKMNPVSTWHPRTMWHYKTLGASQSGTKTITSFLVYLPLYNDCEFFPNPTSHGFSQKKIQQEEEAKNNQLRRWFKRRFQTTFDNNKPIKSRKHQIINIQDGRRIISFFIKGESGPCRIPASSAAVQQTLFSDTLV